MKLSESIKQARLLRDKPILDLLTTVYASVKQKVKDGEHPDRAEITEIEKAVSSRKEAIQLAGDSSFSKQLEWEIDILNQFLPQPMSEAEIQAAIESYLTVSPSAKARDVMGFFKANYLGRYDGKAVFDRCKFIGLT